MTTRTAAPPTLTTAKKLTLKKGTVRHLTARPAASAVGRAGRAPTANCTQVGPACGGSY